MPTFLTVYERKLGIMGNRFDTWIQMGWWELEWYIILIVNGTSNKVLIHLLNAIFHIYCECVNWCKSSMKKKINRFIYIYIYPKQIHYNTLNVIDYYVYSFYETFLIKESHRYYLLDKYIQ